MSELKNAPLLEAIFELQWGQPSPNQFKFNSKEETLLPGIVSNLLSEKGYVFVESLNRVNMPNLPKVATHRFRQKKDSWPCVQIGLGTFTVNQINDGYTWETYKDDIKNAVLIFENEIVINNIEYFEDAHVKLKYQDVFYPSKHNITDKEFIEKYFHIKAEFPFSFYKNFKSNISDDSITMKLNVNIDNLGAADILFASASVNGKKALIVETVVQSNLEMQSIDTWLEEAHDFQRHVFKELINTEAYEC